MPSVKIKDYEEWLKNNKMSGTSGTGSSGTSTPTAYDELENRSLYQQYVDEAAARNTMRDQEALVDKQTASALRDNYVAQEQAKRKANEAMLASGVQTGLSESSLIDLYARGAQARADIISAADDEKRDILSKYRDAVATARSTANSSLAQIETGKDAYEKQNAVDQFNAALTSYEGDEIDFEDLEAAYEKFGGQLDETENYDVLNKYKQFAEKYDTATVNVLSDNFKMTDFGTYNGIRNSDSKQSNYLEQVVEDAKNGKIKEGQYIIPNYGKHTIGRSYVYQYLGNGRFKKVETDGVKLSKMFSGNSDYHYNIYTPEGYDYKDSAWQRFWGTTKVKESAESKKVEQNERRKEKMLAWKEEDPEGFERWKKTYPDEYAEVFGE